MGFATKWKTKKICAKEWSKKHIFLSHFFIFHHTPKRMLKFLGNGFWIVIVQKVQKKCLSHSGKMHFSVSGHVTLGVVRWRHELDYFCLQWVLSKFGPIEAYMCRVIASWFFPSNGIKRYFNGPLTWSLKNVFAIFAEIASKQTDFSQKWNLYMSDDCYQRNVLSLSLKLWALIILMHKKSDIVAENSTFCVEMTNLIR